MVKKTLHLDNIQHQSRSSTRIDFEQTSAGPSKILSNRMEYQEIPFSVVVHPSQEQYHG